MAKYVPKTVEIDRRIMVGMLPGMSWCRMSLNLWGVLLIMGGLVQGPFLYLGLQNATVVPADMVTMVAGVAGVGGLVVSIIWAVVHFIAASGIGNGAKWAWFLGIFLGAMNLFSCLPVGAVILYGLLNKEARMVFLG